MGRWISLHRKVLLMLRNWLPKTVVGQLVGLLAFVLILAQAINLVLLVGSQRLQARTNTFKAAIEHASRLTAELPETKPSDAPYILNLGRGAPVGSFFISLDNRAEEFDSGQSLIRENALFRIALNEKGVDVRATSVTLLAESPIASSPDPDFRRRPPGRKGGRPPRDRHGLDERGAETRGFRPPPPPGRISKPELESLVRPKSLQEIRLSAELANGMWFNALMPHETIEPLRLRIFIATFLLLGLSLLAVWIFARRISRPISSFAEAADRLGRGRATELLPETGPEDLRLAAIAFNTMQTRLVHMLETQRNMLRAVGHDLRTPLTSLRLRAENIEDETERTKVISTINDMTVMTEEILGWAKDASGAEEVAAVDLGSFLESLVDDYQDQGKNVTLEPLKPTTIHIRRISVKRALQNLLNNALDYGSGATLIIEQNSNIVTIHIDDKGPGISEDQLENVLKPFVRLESSRNKETGGTGLGLSIADTIAQIHGGTLRLSNREEGGLRASLTLPI